MSGTRDYASPALSLSLAGVFRNAAAQAEEEVEEGDEESGGGGCRGETVDVSSENTGHSEQEGDDDELAPTEDDGREVTKNKKRKKYHRHTTEQIREMEALFKESPHPDEKQRQQLSKKLGLAPRQVKFWFQNRRTQIKAMQERHENSLLKSEMDKLREENRCMRETINKTCCPNCGSLTSYKDSPTSTTEVQQLRIENARLKAEIEKMRGAGRVPLGTTAASSSSCSPGQEQDITRSTLEDYYSGFFGVDKAKVLEIVNVAMDELIRMATAHEPLWVRSLESGREILNYDEYVREFSPRRQVIRRSIEASRETGVVILDVARLVQSFIDVNQWKDMFSCMISKAATVDIISNGEGSNRNGVVQLMFAELQMLTPMVPTREVYFIRHCRQQSPDVWAVVDVSIDAVEDNIDASLVKCRKLPSGCIIEDKANGHCKVTWVEHIECQRGAVHTMYRPMVNSGVAFGAWHWMATLQQQCERLVFYMATNVPTKDSSGVSTLAGRKSTLKLAQRMSSTFCHAVGASSHTWTKMSTKAGDDMRISTRKNLNDPGEPVGVILCAVSSVWLPVSAGALFDFVRDDARRSEWDMLLAGGATTRTIASISKGQDRGNSVTLHSCCMYVPEELQAVQSRDSRDMWFLQNSCTNAYESMVVYAPVDVAAMQSVMSGCDSGSVATLPSGFSILPDRLVDSSPPVIIARPDQERSAEGGGSLLTVALQVVANASPAAKLTLESVEAVNSLVSSMLQSIKKGMQCEDG